MTPPASRITASTAGKLAGRGTKPNRRPSAVQNNAGAARINAAHINAAQPALPRLNRQAQAAQGPAAGGNNGGPSSRCGVPVPRHLPGAAPRRPGPAPQAGGGEDDWPVDRGRPLGLRLLGLLGALAFVMLGLSVVAPLLQPRPQTPPARGGTGASA